MDTRTLTPEQRCREMFDCVMQGNAVMGALAPLAYDTLARHLANAAHELRGMCLATRGDGPTSN